MQAIVADLEKVDKANGMTLIAFPTEELARAGAEQELLYHLEASSLAIELLECAQRRLQGSRPIHGHCASLYLHANAN
eukprot:1704560-Amphidinium_carterae.1